MTKLSRRTFLQTVSTAAAGTLLAPRSWSQVRGANSDLRVALVGLGGRSHQHLRAFDTLSGVRVTALCDPDRDHLAQAAAGRRAKGQSVLTFTDVRDVLARADIDAVSIAAPNHWHALITVWACQAGKDVYVEKPVSHNIWEGRQEVAAAARYGRIVQTGTQSRSRADIQEAVAWVRSGQLGKLLAVRGLCYKRRPSIGLTQGPQPIPVSVDYNLWTGPAPLTPLRRKHLHYDWHWVWPTGCGDLGNQGVHQMDVARWFLGDPGLPPHTMTVGGRVGYRDDGETPNTVASVHHYAEAPLIFEVRALPARPGSEAMDQFPDAKIGTNVGVVVHCEGGTLVAANGSHYDNGPKAGGDDFGGVAAYDRQGKCVKNFDGQFGAQVEALHFGNFLAAVRSRRPADLRAPIECGHLSSALCHLSNISYQLGAGRPAAEIWEQVRADAALSEAGGRLQEHLRANGVDVAGGGLRLGVPLAVDAAAERFIGNPAANDLLTRHYRAPFVVPSLV